MGASEMLESREEIRSLEEDVGELKSLAITIKVDDFKCLGI